MGLSNDQTWARMARNSWKNDSELPNRTVTVYRWTITRKTLGQGTFVLTEADSMFPGRSKPIKALFFQGWCQCFGFLGSSRLQPPGVWAHPTPPNPFFWAGLECLLTAQGPIQHFSRRNFRCPKRNHHLRIMFPSHSMICDLLRILYPTMLNLNFRPLSWFHIGRLCPR